MLVITLRLVFTRMLATVTLPLIQIDSNGDKTFDSNYRNVF